MMEQQDDSSTLRNRRRSLAANAALRRLSSHNDDYGTEVLGETPEQPQEDRVTDETSKEDVLEKSALLDDLSCPICFRLLYEPLCLPCGHTYCRSCLGKALSAKASQECPTCRAPVVVDTSVALVNVAIQRIMENHFPTELMQRASEEQEEALEKERIRPTLSIFLIPGMVVMPNQKIVLRVFEPRYLLLCERAMQGNRMFGLQQRSNSTVGTLMKIETVQNDGSGGGIRRRLIINAVAIKPYRPEDVQVEADSGNLFKCTAAFTEPPEVNSRNADEIIDNSHHRASEIYEAMPPTQKMRLIDSIGPLPALGEDPYKLLYWLAACLPLHPTQKEGILNNSMNIEDRLVIINGVLFNEARPPRFRVDPGPTFLGRGTVFQSCLIFAICILGICYSYFFKEVVH